MNKLLSISETPEGFDYPAVFILAFGYGEYGMALENLCDCMYDAN